uniref:Palmitoyltransferase n=1 Tax=Trypanosoma vivax (strain Y486) TaxID=1055687 RepID=G0UBT9_TRYVY|nr:conserved hypothetical protein [Trypanosoma vivax Y486]
MSPTPTSGHWSSMFVKSGTGRLSHLRTITSKRFYFLATSSSVGIQLAGFAMLFWAKRTEHFSMVAPLLTAVCFNLSLLWVCKSDPGYVLHSAEPQTQREKALLRFCDICLLWQPLRTKHCSRCERCVRKFDHHCEIVNNCIGGMNHTRFFLLTVVSTVHFASVLCKLVYCFSIRGCANIDAIVVRNAVPFAFAFLYWLAFLISTTLCVLHAVLLATNSTTWEFASWDRITYLSSKQSNPFNRGVCSNLRLLFSRNPIAWDQFVTDSDDYV